MLSGDILDEARSQVPPDGVGLGQGQGQTAGRLRLGHGTGAGHRGRRGNPLTA